MPHCVPLRLEFIYQVCFFDVFHSWGSLHDLEQMVGGRLVVYAFSLVASTNFRISVRMASLRLEYILVNCVSNASTRPRGALNSMSIISCLFLFFCMCVLLSVFLSSLVSFCAETLVVILSLRYLNPGVESFYLSVLELCSIFSRGVLLSLCS